MFEAIPLARRERIAVREVEKGEAIASRVSGFAKLMPEAAALYEKKSAASKR
jgi:hypothetical protein